MDKRRLAKLQNEGNPRAEARMWSASWLKWAKTAHSTPGCIHLSEPCSSLTHMQQGQTLGKQGFWKASNYQKCVHCYTVIYKHLREQQRKNVLCSFNSYTLLSSPVTERYWFPTFPHPWIYFKNIWARVHLNLLNPRN